MVDTALDKQPIPEATLTLYVGGSPCRPVSAAGFKEPLRHEDAHRLQAAVQRIKGTRPEIATLEHVQGLIAPENPPLFDALLDALLRRLRG